MKIAVVCGGISRERDVSISTGTCVAKALRERGHKVALVDLFLGDPQGAADPRSVFSTNNEVNIFSVGENAPDLEAVRCQRGGRELIGPGVIDICRESEIAFLALHGADG